VSRDSLGSVTDEIWLNFGLEKYIREKTAVEETLACWNVEITFEPQSQLRLLYVENVQSWLSTTIKVTNKMHYID
jgi:hypothetical protein